MNSLNDTTLECNPYTKINFDGGDFLANVYNICRSGNFAWIKH